MFFQRFTGQGGGAGGTNPEGENGEANTDGEHTSPTPTKTRRESLHQQQSSLNYIKELISHDQEASHELLARRKKAELNFDLDRAKLDALAKQLRKKLNLSKQRRTLHWYDESFRGAAAVDYLVANSVCADPDDAKNILRHLLYRRVILRIDHTRPMLNAVIRSLAPSLADWRQKMQLHWYQDSVRSFNVSALYVFNPYAFAKFKVYVRVICARGLRYNKRNTIRGNWVPKQISPVAGVSYKSQTFLTSVEAKTNQPRWDEVFSFPVETEVAQNQGYLPDVWVKIFDFRQLGESFPLGQVSISIESIMKNCLTDPAKLPPANPDDAPGWLMWHPLLPPTDIPNPDQVRGGEVQLEIQLCTNVVSHPDETIFDECRPAYHDEIELNTETPTDRVAIPPTVLKYQHIDRRNSADLAAAAALAMEQRNSEKNDNNNATEPESSSGMWKLKFSSIEIRGFSDKGMADSVVWIEVIAKTSKSSKILAARRKKRKAAGDKNADSTTDESFIARSRSVPLLWPAGGASVVRCGEIVLSVPNDVLSYIQVEFRLVKKEMVHALLCRGKMKLGNVKKTDDDDPNQSEDSDGEDNGNRSHTIKANVNEAPTYSNALPQAEFTEQSPIDDKSPFGVIVVMRKQAAFKRNVKIKVCQLHTEARLVADESDATTWDDGANLGDHETEQPHPTFNLEEMLQVVIPEENEAIVPIPLPAPFEHVYCEDKVTASVPKLAQILLSKDSKFGLTLGLKNNNTDIEVGEWVIGKRGSGVDSLTSFDSLDMKLDDKDSDSPQSNRGSSNLLLPELSHSDSFESTGSVQSDSSSVVSNTDSMRMSTDSVTDLGGMLDATNYPSRQNQFRIPASAVSKAALVSQEDRILDMGPGGFVRTSVNDAPEVPFGERFVTKIQIVVQYVNPTTSYIRYSGEVAWKEKGPPPFPVKGMILNGVRKGQQEACDAELAFLKEWIAPRVTRRKKKTGAKTAEEMGAPEKRMSKTRFVLYFIALLVLIAGMIVPLVFPDEMSLFLDKIASSISNYRKQKQNIATSPV